MTNNNELTQTNPFLGRVGLNFEGAEPAKVWVDSIAGMSVELADNLRAEDAQALWERMQPVVYDRFASRLESILSKRSAFRHIIARTVTSMPQPTIGVVSANMNGLLVTATAAGEHVSLTLGPLTCYSAPPTQELTLIVEDLDTLEELYSESVTLDKGRNSLLTTPVKLPMSQYLTTLAIRFKEDAQFALRCMMPNYTTTDDLCIVALDGDEESCLFHLNAVLTCDFASVIKRYAEYLDWAYAYQCAHFLLDEKLSSSLMNVYTNTNRDDTAQRRDEYLADVDKRIGQACDKIVRDMEAGASPFLFVDESTQPGLHMGGYV